MPFSNDKRGKCPQKQVMNINFLSLKAEQKMCVSVYVCFLCVYVCVLNF